LLLFEEDGAFSGKNPSKTCSGKNESNPLRRSSKREENQQRKSSSKEKGSQDQQKTSEKSAAQKDDKTAPVDEEAKSRLSLLPLPEIRSLVESHESRNTNRNKSRNDSRSNSHNDSQNGNISRNNSPRSIIDLPLPEIRSLVESHESRNTNHKSRNDSREDSRNTNRNDPPNNSGNDSPNNSVLITGNNNLNNISRNNSPRSIIDDNIETNNPFISGDICENSGVNDKIKNNDIENNSTITTNPLASPEKVTGDASGLMEAEEASALRRELAGTLTLVPDFDEDSTPSSFRNGGKKILDLSINHPMLSDSEPSQEKTGEKKNALEMEKREEGSDSGGEESSSAEMIHRNPKWMAAATRKNNKKQNLLSKGKNRFENNKQQEENREKEAVPKVINGKESAEREKTEQEKTGESSQQTNSQKKLDSDGMALVKGQKNPVADESQNNPFIEKDGGILGGSDVEVAKFQDDRVEKAKDEISDIITSDGGDGEIIMINEAADEVLINEGGTNEVVILNKVDDEDDEVIQRNPKFTSKIAKSCSSSKNTQSHVSSSKNTQSHSSSNNNLPPHAVGDDSKNPPPGAAGDGIVIQEDDWEGEQAQEAPSDDDGGEGDRDAGENDHDDEVIQRNPKFASLAGTSAKKPTYDPAAVKHDPAVKHDKVGNEYWWC